MGLMDKVKAQATQLAEKAQEAGKVGQQKLGDFQTKKQADALLRELGALHFAQVKGRGDGQTDSKIAGVIAQLDAYEAEHGPVDLTPDPIVQGTTNAAGGIAPPVSNVVQGGSTIVTSAPDVSGVPSGSFGGVGGVPSGGVGGIPSGGVGGVPSGGVGGVPSGGVGGVPSGGVGGVPSGSVGGLPSGNTGDLPPSPVGDAATGAAGGLPEGAIGETPQA